MANYSSAYTGAEVDGAVGVTSLFGRKSSTTTGLTWGFFGGQLDLLGTLTTIADGTVVLSASDTNYVEAASATGAVTANTTAFTAGAIPLYTIITDVSAITSYVDYRNSSQRLMAAQISGATAKTTPVDADSIGMIDSEASSILKELTFANLWVWVQSKLALGTGVATFLSTPSSANLAAAVTDETGTGALVFSTSPQFTGTIGLNNAPLTTTAFRCPGATLLSGATTQYGYVSNATFGSDCTVAGNGYSAQPSTTAAAYTMTVMRAYNASGLILGAGSAVTTYVGFNCADESDATNNKAFIGNMSAGANKWNLSMEGTAINYLNGALLIGSSTDDTVNKLQVTGSIKTTTTIQTGGYTVATLPAGATGQRAYVTDATTPTYNAALTGGGAVVVPVFYNGAAWVSA